VLSIYNSDHLCFTHADEVSRAAFERVSARIARSRALTDEELPELIGA
jgi:hypothetical protein